ncbi:MAG: acyl-CoA dehydrogenase family protein [Chloroflexi bacterium]|nr:acyl-CoA dehydrogenase family protein [Chloroflexota bacterium]
MDLSLTREQEMLKKAVREFAELKVAPRALELDERGDFPYDLVKAMGQMGLIGVINSRQYGGSGMGHLARMIIIEELSRTCPGLGFFMQTANLLMYVLENFGSEDQKNKHIPDLCKGNKLSAFGITEQSGGSDPTSMMTVARPDAGGYIVNGRKTFITSAQVADVLGFVARTGDSFSAFLMEKGTPGFEVTRREPRPGIRCIPVNELAFTNCPLPKENLIGQEGRGLAAAITAISVIGRTGAAAVALGTAQGAYEGALKFCKERMLYGKPIASLQAIQFMLVDMNTDIEAARWLCYRPAWLLDQGKSPRDAGADIARAKLFSVDMAIRTCLKAQQAMGAYGQSPEYRVEMYLRDALELLVAAGTQEIMRVTIGRAITG